MLGKFIARDLIIAAATASVWLTAGDWMAGTGPVADLLGLLVGLGAAFSVVKIHEWGHFLGAAATGSNYRLATRLGSTFMFAFDSKDNSKRQFLVMSLGGFIGTAIVLVVSYALLPDEVLATRITRGMAVLGALAGIVLEVPLLLRGMFGTRLPPLDKGLGARLTT
jgi:hypothetical protein